MQRSISVNSQRQSVSFEESKGMSKKEKTAYYAQFFELDNYIKDSQKRSELRNTKPAGQLGKQWIQKLADQIKNEDVDEA
jgi:hypothetical protein